MTSYLRSSLFGIYSFYYSLLSTFASHKINTNTQIPLPNPHYAAQKYFTKEIRRTFMRKENNLAINLWTACQYI